MLPDSNNKSSDIVMNNTPYAEMAMSLNSAWSVVNKTYLSRLDTLPVVPMAANLKMKRDTVRVFEIARIVYDRQTASLDGLVNAYTALGMAGYSAALILSSNGEKTRMCLAVRSQGNGPDAQSGYELLSQAIEGNLPGTEIGRRIKYDRLGEEGILCPRRLFDNYPQWALASFSGIPSMKNEDMREFSQGLERFIDAMQGKAYEAVLLADPLDAQTLARVQTGYETMATTLSSLAKSQVTLGRQESRTLSETLTDGISKSLTVGVSLSQSHTAGESFTSTSGTSDTKSTTLGASGLLPGAIIGAGIGFMLSGPAGVGPGAFIGSFAGASINMSKSRSLSESTSHSKSTNTSSSRSQTDSRNETDTTSSSRAEGTSDTSGISYGIQLEQHNKTVEHLMERITQQLKRIDEARAYGLWNTAGYFFATDTATARTAACLYMGMMRGKESHVEDAAVNVWDANSGKELNNDGEIEKRAAVLAYVENLLHPRFRLNSEQDGDIFVSPASFVSGKEVALMLNLPRRSVCGVSVLNAVGFGQEVRSLAPVVSSEDNTSRRIPLGKVRNKYQDRKVDVELSLDGLTLHTLVTGTTGVGKSTAVRNLLAHCHKGGIPFLVVEPVKEEYGVLCGLSGNNPPVRFQAGRHGKDCLRLNPLVFSDTATTVIEHADRVCALFNAAFPMYAAMPQLLEESVLLAYENCGWDLVLSKNIHEIPRFPTLRDVADLIPSIVERAGYRMEAQSTYVGALTTRLRSLTRGALGLTFMVEKMEETPAKELFERSCIVNVSGVGSAEKRALLMGLLMIRLHEHRIGQGGRNGLRHLMVLEEAHHLLKRSAGREDMESANAQGQAVESLANNLAEMRAYGQGFLVVDQSPSALDVSVLRNTNTKIAFRAPFDADRKILGGALALDEKQADMLAVLENHTALIKQNDWLETVHCHLDGPLFPSQVAETPVLSVGNPARAAHTLLVWSLLEGRRRAEARDYPGHVPDWPRPLCQVNEALEWIGSLGLSSDFQAELEKALRHPEEKRSLEEIIPLLLKIPIFAEMPKVARQCSSSEQGELNHILAHTREVLDITEKRVLHYVAHAFHRAIETAREAYDSDRETEDIEVRRLMQ